MAHRAYSNYSGVFESNGNSYTDEYIEAVGFIDNVRSDRNSPLRAEAMALKQAYYHATASSDEEYESMLSILDFYRKRNSEFEIVEWVRKRNVDEFVPFDEGDGKYLIEHPEDVISVTLTEEGFIDECSKVERKFNDATGRNSLVTNVGSASNRCVIKGNGGIGWSVYKITYRKPKQSDEERMRILVDEALTDLTGTALTARLAEIVRDFDKNN